MPNWAFRWSRATRSGRLLHERLFEVAQRSISKLPALARCALPNPCVLCGNMSHRALCGFCDEAWWNEARLRCVVCAMPLSSFRRASVMHYRCGDCLAAPPAFDATVALADYRAPLDALAVGLKFRANSCASPSRARNLRPTASASSGAR